MKRNILVIQGHPDPRGDRFGHALAAAYADAARAAGHRVDVLDIARLDFPLLRTKEDFEDGPVPAVILVAQQAIGRADHLVLFYPLWLGDMPALLKGFLEQAFRPGFAVGRADRGNRSGGLLKGKSARIVVTMGMPAFIYRWFFGAHSLKSLRRNILQFSGVRPVRVSLVGLVEGDERRRTRWLERMRSLGRAGA